MNQTKTLFLSFLIASVYSFSLLHAATLDKTNIKKIVKGWLKTSPPYVLAEQKQKPFKAGDVVLEV